MKYYKDKNGQVFAYEDDGSQDNLIGNKLAMSNQEIEAHINPPKTEEQLLAEWKDDVQSAIDKTDLVALRCWKAGIEFPTDWKEYTVALRALLTSAIVDNLPTMPNYPSGS